MNVVKEDTNDECDVLLATDYNVAKSKWVKDSATCMHVYEISLCSRRRLWPYQVCEWPKGENRSCWKCSVENLRWCILKTSECEVHTDC